MPRILNYPPQAQTPCPKNNFGLGESYVLNDDERVELMEKWDTWESEFPEDPMGEEYIRRYKLKQAEIRMIALPSSDPDIADEDCRDIIPIVFHKEIPETNPHKIPMGRPRKVMEGDSCQVRLILTTELRTAFQAKCFEEGKPMSQKVRELIQAYLNP